MTERNRQTNVDLSEEIKELRARIRVLERQLRASSTSVRSGAFSLVDSRFTFTDAVDGIGEGTRGRITMLPYLADSDEGYALHVDRAVGMGGEPAMQITTVDGSMNTESFLPTVKLFDKKGGSTVVADAAGHRRGMSEPRLQIPWHIFSQQLQSSTSDSFTDLGSFNWYAYHPHLSVSLIIQNDASTDSEVEIRDPFGNLFSEMTFPGSTNAYVDMPAIRREALVNDQDGVNGNPQFMTVRFRRSAGAGTVRAMITDIVGIDLSLFD